MKFVSLLVLFVFALRCHAQQPNHEIVEVLETLESITWESSISQESLVDSAARLLLEQLKTEEINCDSLNNLSKSYSDDSLLISYTIHYNTGGTMSSAYYSILQWKKKDGTYSVCYLYGFLDGKDGPIGEFSEMHKLNSGEKNLYFIVGYQRGSSVILTAHAKIIEIANDTINDAYAGFQGKYIGLTYLDNIDSGNEYCLACIDWDPDENLMYIGELGEADKFFLEHPNKAESAEIEVIIQVEAELTFTLKDGVFWMN